MFPWGSLWDLEEEPPRLNFFGVAGGSHLRPTGSFPRGRSVYGSEDMLGNVWEWVADWYDPNYYERSPRIDPEGPPPGSSGVIAAGENGLIRGGSWGTFPELLHIPYRRELQATVTNNVTGFRCARDA